MKSKLIAMMVVFNLLSSWYRDIEYIIVLASGASFVILTPFFIVKARHWNEETHLKRLCKNEK